MSFLVSPLVQQLVKEVDQVEIGKQISCLRIEFEQLKIFSQKTSSLACTDIIFELTLHILVLFMLEKLEKFILFIGSKNAHRLLFA